MKISSKTWSKVGSIAGAIGFLITMLTPIISNQAAEYENEQFVNELEKELDKRYALKEEA